jgi:hypothetical protein
MQIYRNDRFCLIPNLVCLSRHVAFCYLMFVDVGEWLLDPRLQNKRLDICIRGTTVKIWHNGTYKNACSFLVLTKAPTSVNDLVIVKIRYNQSKIYFPLHYIFPQITTERSMSRSAASPVVKTIGKRVVIIGSDVEGTSNYIGQHAVVIRCIWPLLHDQGCLQILTSGPNWGTIRYFNDHSLCQSDTG